MDYLEEVDRGHRILDYSMEEIEEYLVKVRELVCDSKYSIPLKGNRSKNKRFIERYNLNTSRINKILNSLTVYDFAYGTRNRNKGYEHEILYIFFKEYEDIYPEGLKKVPMYLKMNLIKEPVEIVVVISFHEQSGDIKLLFEKE